MELKEMTNEQLFKNYEELLVYLIQGSEDNPLIHTIISNTFGNPFTHELNIIFT